MEHRKYMSMF